MDQATAWLWLAVAGSGLYHGVNPGMGWPLAVSAALMDGGRQALWRALAALGIGHMAAMALVLLPFALLSSLVVWQREIRIGAGLVVVAMGLWLLINRRHPRFLARIKPTRLALWSFAVAVAHGAGLMLVPIYLGLCGPGEAGGHGAMALLAAGNLVTAVVVAAVHAAAMLAACTLLAWAVYRWLGLKFVSQSWFNLDVVWAVSLVVIGGIGVAAAI